MTYAYDLTCVAHVHSTFSDGTATVEEIADAAAQAGAEAVLLTDHDTRGAARAGLEGWHGDVLVLVGHEITTRHGHMLAFGVEKEIAHAGLTEPQICAALEAAGGFGIAAHPFSEGGFAPAIVRPHPWRALGECAPCGIELWSLTTDAAERWRTPWAALRFLRDPEASLDGPPRRHLTEWDRLCQARRTPAIGGLDAHQPGIRVRGRVLSPMPHARYFRLLRTHVLLPQPPARDPEADRWAVYAALQEGRCYLASDVMAPSRGFRFNARAGRNEAAIQMGSEVPAEPLTLNVETPGPSRIRLLRDGHTVAETRGTTLTHRTEQAGVYRVEASLSWRGRERRWIVSNPIYLRPPG